MTTNYLPFMFQYTLSVIVFDAFFHYSISNLFKGKTRHLYHILLAICVFMGVFSFYVIYLQYTNTIPNFTEKLLTELQTIWYLPKVILAPVLFVKLMSNYLRNKVSLAPISNIFERRFYYTKKNIYKIVQYISLAPQPILQLYGNMQMSQSDDVFYTANFESEQTNENSTNNSRRNFLNKTPWMLAGIPFGIVSYGALRTTYSISVHKAFVNLQSLPPKFEKFKIVHISDIHSGSFRSDEFIAEAIEIINNLDADIIAITGDFVNYHYQEYDLISRTVTEMKSKYGNFGCLGNHDHFMSRNDTELLIKRIEDSGISLLINSNQAISIGEQKIFIAGVDNSGYGQSYADFDKALNNINDNDTAILLCHDPNNWDESVVGKQNVDLMLSGHTHGGQAGINVFGKIITPAMFYYEQFAGLYKQNEQYLYVNRGLGNSGIPIRVGVEPEITLIELQTI